MPDQQIATLWFPNEAEYARYQEACREHDAMRPFASWLERAERTISEHERRGVRIVKVYAGVEAFLAFCRTRKINPDRVARSVFAAWLIGQEHSSRN